MFGQAIRNRHWVARDRKALTIHRYTRIVPTAVLRLTPMKLIQVLLWKVPPPRPDEIEISKNCLKTARTLIAVCEKARAYDYVRLRRATRNGEHSWAVLLRRADRNESPISSG
jgi:hypothetical protein